MSGFTPDVSAWNPVSLGELERRAALLDREENKYVVTTTVLTQALTCLENSFDILSISRRPVFTYDTVYFDTDDLLCYRQHQQGRRRRMKVRSRRYVDSDLCFFEVKLKGHRGRTIKERIRYGLDVHGTVTDEADAFLRSCVEEHYGTTLHEPLRPALAMRYRRLTLVGRSSAERVTIDFGLEFRSSGLVQHGPDSTVIVEVKSADGHGQADEVFHQLGVRPESCSKYCVGLNLLRNDLTYNPFNTTLRRHFAWEGRPRP